MIRKAFIQKRVLSIYQQSDPIQYPLRPETVLPLVSTNTRMMTYQELADITQSTVREIALLCRSYDGATHFDTAGNRFLILYNENDVPGRVRWTQFHEIGHICLGHFDTLNTTEIASGESMDQQRQALDMEADYFAWNMMAPLPILREMHIQSAKEIEQTFGMSAQAAALQFDRYLKWCRGHIKTAWENEMLRAFRQNHTKT